ncbi:hypothetical protein [Nocardia sp. NBC_01388]|uniref:hypothetical protein n=1 Tax=Nocardia sp. NBC_01388 TaxID=2903596 RepID=UPI002F90EA4A
MPSLEEEFGDFTDRVKRIDLAALAEQRNALREELAALDDARSAVAGARREVLDKLSDEAFAVLERRIYTLEHPTHLDPHPPRDRRRDR